MQKPKLTSEQDGNLLFVNFPETHRLDLVNIPGAVHILRLDFSAALQEATLLCGGHVPLVDERTDGVEGYIAMGWVRPPGLEVVGYPSHRAQEGVDIRRLIRTNLLWCDALMIYRRFGD